MSLKMANSFLANAEDDKYHWKWMLVALHNSLQGFMACSLRGGDGLAAMKDRVAQKWLEAKQSGQPLPREELDTFLNLYRKIKSDRMLFSAQSRYFIPRGQQDYSVRKLNRLRNHFVHFTPKSWSVEINYLPRVSQDCIRVIKFLVFSSGNIEPISEELKSEIVEIINSMIDRLAKMDALYKI